MSDLESDDDIRRYALDCQRQHDPDQQEGNGYARCMHCHYTRHPCDVYDLATTVLMLMDRGRTDDPWQRFPVGEYTGLAAEKIIDERG
jgi:hypothetical protein